MPANDKGYNTATSLEKGQATYGIDNSTGLAIATILYCAEQLLPAMPFRRRSFQAMCAKIPRTSECRQKKSCGDQAYGTDQIAKLSASEDTEDTVLYLGYGSNLSAETFLGKRGIRPLSQVNIVAPSIALTFDLPGLPYSEPCFANSRYRDEPNPDSSGPKPPYHKNAWKKGLVGVVYEVTKKDYAHIIATEGGGSGYHDVLVECWALDDDADKTVPEVPTGPSFKAHTLYAHRDRALRLDPDYAQPSARYLKLITDGADEHNLPKEYRHFLGNIRSYQTTTAKQRLGSFVFLATWGPIFAFFFGGARLFLRKDGTYPPWFAVFAQGVFTAVWASYDEFFFKLFGDGERTIGDEKSRDSPGEGLINEKTPLLVEETVKVAM